MGFLKKIFKPVQKVVQKIVPKEVRPFLPYAAAAFGPAALAGTKFATLNPAFQKALLASVTAAATDKDANILRTAALAATPDVLSQGLGKFSQAYGFSPADVKALSSASELTKPSLLEQGAALAGRGAEAIQGIGTLKTIGAQTAIDASAKLAEINEKELADYEASLVEKGIRDKESRRSAIFNIYKNAGYESDYVNSVLDKYGYADGGQVLMASAPDPMDALNDLAMQLFGKPLYLLTPSERDALDDYNSGLMAEGGVVSVRPKMTSASMRGFGEKYLEFLKEKNKNKKEKKAYGGRVGLKKGGDPRNAVLVAALVEKGMDLERAMDLAEKEFPYEPYNTEDYLGMATSGLQDAFGVENLLQGEMAEPMRIIPGFKDGGIGSINPDELPMSREGSPKYYDEKGNEISLKEFEKRMKEDRTKKANGGRTYKDFERFMRDKQRYYRDKEKENLMEEFEHYMRRNDPVEAKDGGSIKFKDIPKIKESVVLEEAIKKGLIDKKDIERLLDESVLTRKLLKKPKNFKDGGIMNLGGKEMDMRGGGFIPIGAKEKADDVPARLSKNEFVMTADAVRAAGGGNVNKGAKRMYQLMNKLEARA
jgi:hypothetical protein